MSVHSYYKSFQNEKDTKTKIQETVENTLQGMGKLSDKDEKVPEQVAESVLNPLTELIEKTQNCTTLEDLKQIQAGTSKILELITRKGDGGNGNPFLADFVNSFQVFLDSLTTQQKGALVFTIAAIFMLKSLVDILIIHYSDILINKFRIEEKFPSIGK